MHNVLNFEHLTYNKRMWGVFMFAVLKVHPYQKPPIFKRLFYRKPEPILTKTPLRGGAFFYTAEFFCDKHGCTDISILPDLVGGCAQRILLSDSGIPILPPLQVFTPILYPQLLFLNTALDFLKKLPDAPNARTLGFVDADAQLQEKIVPFVRQAKTVKIFTEFPLRYDAFAGKLLAEWGLSVVVSSCAEVLRDCTVVLAPFFQVKTGDCGVLYYSGNETYYIGDKFVLPAEAETRRPFGVDAVKFASALYELCNWKDLVNLRYERLKPIKSDAIY